MELIKIRITSKGMLTSFGYNLRTPAVVDLYPNQIAILKASGVKFATIEPVKKEDPKLPIVLDEQSLEDIET